MAKRTILAFSLSLLVIIGYNYYMSKKYPSQEGEQLFEEKEKDLLQSSSAKMLTEEAAISTQGELNQAHLPTTKLGGQAKDIIVETDLVKLVITSSGARIKSCRLKRYAEEAVKPAVIEKQIKDLEKKLTYAPVEAREFLQREKEKLAALLNNANPQPSMAELVSLAAKVDADYPLTILFNHDKNVTSALNLELYRCAADSLILSQAQPTGQLEFIYTDPQGRTLKKILTFSNSNYNIGLEIIFANWQIKDQPSGYFLLSWGPDLGLPLASRGRRTYSYEGPITYFLTPQAGWIKKEKYARQEGNVLVRRQYPGKVGWAGLENKYFLAALIPEQPADGVLVEKNKFGEHKVAIKVSWEGERSYNFRFYLGPKKEDQLKQIGVSLEKSIDYGFFSPIARLIYQILVFFSRGTHNFGWAIVLLCLLTKLVFYPLTHRSFESMQKIQTQMQSIQPEINELREKFRDNPQKLNKEIMELYRRKGINPLASCQSGCLPLVLQMPVFFSLYAVLYNSIELRGEPFLGWVKDLSAADPYYILPILMGVSMFGQQKLTGMGTISAAQQEQAKLMNLLMPFLLTWIFANLPSGVVLYWLTFNLLAVGEQLAIKKRQKQ